MSSSMRSTPLRTDAAVLLCVLVVRIRVTPQEELGIDVDHAKRLLQIVAGNIGELFQLAIRALQSSIVVSEGFEHPQSLQGRRNLV